MRIEDIRQGQRVELRWSLHEHGSTGIVFATAAKPYRLTDTVRVLMDRSKRILPVPPSNLILLGSPRR